MRRWVSGGAPLPMEVLQRLVTKNVWQPDLANASATGSMPQP